MSYSSIKQYDFEDINDIFYILMWMEELYPNFGFRMDLPNNNSFNKALLEWNNMKLMKKIKQFHMNSTLIGNCLMNLMIAVRDTCFFYARKE